MPRGDKDKYTDKRKRKAGGDASARRSVSARSASATKAAAARKRRVAH